MNYMLHLTTIDTTTYLLLQKVGSCRYRPKDSCGEGQTAVKVNQFLAGLTFSADLRTMPA